MAYNENLMQEALKGDKYSLRELKSNAGAGNAEAQYYLALYWGKLKGNSDPECQYWMKKSLKNGYQIAEKNIHKEQIEKEPISSGEEDKDFLKIFLMKFSFMGKIGRREYIISFAILFATVFLIGKIDNPSAQGFLNLVANWFFLSQTARRFHDFGESGWWALIPVISWIWALFPKSINLEDVKMKEISKLTEQEANDELNRIGFNPTQWDGSSDSLPTDK